MFHNYRSLDASLPAGFTPWHDRGGSMSLFSHWRASAVPKSFSLMDCPDTGCGTCVETSRTNHKDGLQRSIDSMVTKGRFGRSTAASRVGMIAIHQCHIPGFWRIAVCCISWRAARASIELERTRAMGSTRPAMRSGSHGARLPALLEFARTVWRRLRPRSRARMKRCAPLSDHLLADVGLNGPRYEQPAGVRTIRRQ